MHIGPVDLLPHLEAAFVKNKEGKRRRRMYADELATAQIADNDDSAATYTI